VTPRERILAVLHGALPDRVPCVPDISNMVPCRLTGKPFWDIYLYQDPPLWKAFIDALKYYGVGGFLRVSVELDGPDSEKSVQWTKVIIKRTTDRIITRSCRETDSGERAWSPQVQIYDRWQPDTAKHFSVLGLPEVPSEWEPVEGVRQWPGGEALVKLIKDEMGEHGVISMRCGSTKFLASPEDVFAFYDNPEPFYHRRDEYLEFCEKLFQRILELETKPDFITMGGSGTLVFQTPVIFRELGLPILRRMSELCRKSGIPSHVHSCGPESVLVRAAAEETDLTIIDPLEPPPMGDCDLRELKQSYGNRIALKGNLHTTDVMLRGSAKNVLEASRTAICDAAEGGGFILSTGDQCGRDTPDDNILAMVEACEKWGGY